MQLTSLHQHQHHFVLTRPGVIYVCSKLIITSFDCLKVHEICICSELQEPVKSILLILEYVEGEGSPVPATAELKVGAIQTAQFASKKVKKIRSAVLCQTL